MTRLLSSLLTEGSPALPVAFRRGRPIPFARFRDDVATAAADFRGFRHAALVCHDSYAFAVGLFGLLHAGAEVVLPNNGQPATIERLTADTEAVIDDQRLGRLDRQVGEMPPLDVDRARITFFTSGSTGRPKPVTRTLGMLEREVAVLDRLWGATTVGSGPVLATVSHQHLYGMTFKVLWSLTTGRPFAADMHEVWETLLADLTPGACIISSPAHLGRLAGIAPLPETCRPAAVFSAGAPLAASAAAAAEAILGCLPIEIFGSTETGAFASRRQSVGDESWTLFPGNRIETDADGCLTLDSSYGDGWVKTADIVELTTDGFRFLGRADRIVKIEGKRVSLPDVELSLAALPWVDAAAAVIIAGEMPHLAAAVVLTAAGRNKLSELGNFRFGRMLRQELAATQEPAGRPRFWRFVEALPTRTHGKRADTDVAALFAKEPA
ncbi:AMP-binding protein [Telmatospirillum sp.]|uniref:AMP-binding protein n=1 Tax=Telmatospirillum sp. TaxID=2079197 RepID=UPI00284EFCEE|nr:AMP-binding protein [Telmatospirillum sp.]MDR3439082.1 AMP-binding protein [Telmatospirillum sp.]